MPTSEPATSESRSANLSPREAAAREPITSYLPTDGIYEDDKGHRYQWRVTRSAPDHATIREYALPSGRLDRTIELVARDGCLVQFNAKPATPDGVRLWACEPSQSIVQTYLQGANSETTPIKLADPEIAWGGSWAYILHMDIWEDAPSGKGYEVTRFFKAGLGLLDWVVQTNAIDPDAPKVLFVRDRVEEVPSEATVSQEIPKDQIGSVLPGVKTDSLWQAGLVPDVANHTWDPVYVYATTTTENKPMIVRRLLGAESRRLTDQWNTSWTCSQPLGPLTILRVDMQSVGFMYSRGRGDLHLEDGTWLVSTRTGDTVDCGK